MITERHFITVGGLQIQIVHKDIKNLHLGVYPPNGRVRVAAPLAMSIDAVRLAIIKKLGWIKRQRSKFTAQPRQSEREMVSGESHYFLGRHYRLHVIEDHGPSRVVLLSGMTMKLYVQPQTNARQRDQVLQSWYRNQLKAMVPVLIEKWQLVVGVQVAEWGVKKMKTKWGSCNKEARRIWINLALAKKPVHCLEYIIVHEMVHILERRHNERFRVMMNQFMPKWGLYREELNRAPLGHEKWGY